VGILMALPGAGCNGAGSIQSGSGQIVQVCIVQGTFYPWKSNLSQVAKSASPSLLSSDTANH
jgi:hypothetical protein